MGQEKQILRKSKVSLLIGAAPVTMYLTFPPIYWATREKRSLSNRS